MEFQVTKLCDTILRYLLIHYLIFQKEGRLFLLSFLAAFDCCLMSFGCRWVGTELCRTGFSPWGTTELFLFCTTFPEFCLQNRGTSGTPYSMSVFKAGTPVDCRAPPWLPWVWDETLSKSAAPFPAQKNCPIKSIMQITPSYITRKDDHGPQDPYSIRSSKYFLLRTITKRIRKRKEQRPFNLRFNYIQTHYATQQLVTQTSPYEYLWTYH